MKLFSILRKTVALMCGVALLLAFAVSCRALPDDYNYNQSLQGLYQHMHTATGCTFDGPALSLPIYAENGFFINLAGRQVGFYKYNTVKKGIHMAKLQYVKEHGFIYINGIKLSAIANGSFIMVDHETNKRRDDLVKAFRSFSK